jgi:hypothetical protein
MTDYAKEADVKAGDKLVADDGFTCIEPFKTLTVEEDDHGLFVSCAEGHHYLDGQLEDGDHYIGLTKP